MKRLLCGVLLLLSMAGGVHAQTLRPKINLVSPTGGQRGTTVDFALLGTNLGYGTQVFADGPGLTVESVTPEAPPANAKNPDGKIVAKIKIAPETPPGRYPLRVVTPFGPSEAGYIVVGEWPEAEEKEPNANPQQAQALTGPITVNGRCDGEDVDVYRVTIQKGETIVFSAAAGSIGSALTPVLTLRDANGHDRAFAAALSQPDALLTFTAPQTGDYYLHVRDLRYQGSPNHFYRLTVGKIPAVTSVFPLGGTGGNTLRLALNGVNLPSVTEWKPPRSTEPTYTSLPLPHVGGPRLEVGILPEITEEGNNDLPANAQAVTIPVTINGRISVPYSTKPDVDCFRFTAAKGQAITMEVIAARLGSSLDAVLTVMDKSGKELANNDDARGRDAALTFTSPEAGEYIVRVSDLNGRSGETFGYRLRLALPTPDFQLTFSPDCLAIAPGDRVQFTVAVNRQNFQNVPIAFTLEGLPAGIKLLGPTVIPGGETSTTLIAVADEKAAPAVAPLRVIGTATIGDQTITRRAESHVEFYTKDGERLVRNTRPMPFALAAVTGPSDLILNGPTERVTLAVGKTVEIKVIVQRKAGFTAKIPLLLYGLPNGVSVSGPAEIPENKNEATLTLKAEANAAVSEVVLSLLGRSIVDELRFSEHAALTIPLTVTK
jgi:hypothetical protein